MSLRFERHDAGFELIMRHIFAEPKGRSKKRVAKSIAAVAGADAAFCSCICSNDVVTIPC